MTESPAETNVPGRRVLLRDIAVLQLKLLLDGLRDVMLVPASLVAGAVSLARGRDGHAGSEFYRVLALGRQSEQWINLFGALRNAPPGIGTGAPQRDTDIDAIVARMENFIVDEYRRGGITEHASERLGRALDALRKRTRRDRQTDER